MLPRSKSTPLVTYSIRCVCNVWPSTFTEERENTDDETGYGSGGMHCSQDDSYVCHLLIMSYPTICPLPAIVLRKAVE